MLGMETEPFRAPVPVGVKVTSKGQVSDGATVTLSQALFVSAKSPLIESVPMSRFATPVLVTVKVFAALEEPDLYVKDVREFFREVS